ncbi:metallophosphoesterase [Bacteroidales bacterium OttesenSCG-928-M06]|nr:metallophosphoesterase [Bacteroidales bacterium OttesenSCG-928-M06]
MMLGRNIFPIGIQKVFYFLGTTWLAIMLYITIYFLLTDFIYWLNRFLHFIPQNITSRLFYRAQVFSGYIIIFIILFVGHQKFTHPVAVEKEIFIDKPGTNFKELKVVAFSDIHLGITIDKEKLKKYVRLINEQEPDIILIAGDMIDNNTRPLMEEKMYEEINRLQAPLGIYLCLGNHEYLSGIEQSLEFLKKTNVILLRDKALQIDDSFWVIGRDDRFNENRLSLDELVAKTDPSQPLFLLDHQPYHLEVAEENGIDLQFSGHTHNGQLWPLNLIVDRIYEVGHGYKEKGNTHIYISSGLALWGPEYRIGTQSELVVFNIRFN